MTMSIQSLKMMLTTSLLAAVVGTLGCDRLDDVIRDHLDGPNGAGSGGRGGTDPRDPPPSGDQCREGRDASGNPCRMCVDATGAVVIDTCTVPPSPPAPGPIDHCDVREDPATGVACRICYDAAGVLVHDGCNPAPQPSCETVVYEGGLACKICYDASGTAISRTCASRS